MTRGMDGRRITHATAFTLVKASSGWDRTLAEHPGHDTCLAIAQARATAVENGTFDIPDTHVLRRGG